MSLHVWDLSTSDPAYVCGREPAQPVAVHITIQSRVAASVTRLERTASRMPVCKNCLRGVRARSRRAGEEGGR